MTVPAVPPENTDSTTNTVDPMSYAKLGFLVLLAWLAWGAFHDEVATVPLVSDIDVAVHEFGHNLFMPFGIQFLGNTMMILGGSLVQVAFPLIFVGYFLKKQKNGFRRDVYAAMVCLWWTSINLLSVAIYCADARARVLMMINGATGQEDDSGHDWYNLLTRWHLLKKDTFIAHNMRVVAVLMCLGSLAVAAWIALNPRPKVIDDEIAAEDVAVR